MMSIEHLEKIYSEYFKGTFDKLSFERYETSNGFGRGSWIKFKNSAFRIQLLYDSGLVETDISPLYDKEDFRGIELYNSLLLLKDTSNNLSHSDRKKILGARLDYISQSKFLMNAFSQLKNLLDKDNYRTTLREIQLLGQGE